MSSVDSLRDFVAERLNAAAEEIFRVFKQTVVEYEEEIDRQRRLLHVVLKPEIKLHRTALPQQKSIEEERELFLSIVEQQQEPPHIKEEVKEFCSSQDTLMLTPTREGSDHREPAAPTSYQQLLSPRSDSETQTEFPQQHVFKEEFVFSSPEVLKQETDTFRLTLTDEGSDHGEPEPTSDQQLLSQSSAVAESQRQEGSGHVDPEQPGNTETRPRKRCRKNTSDSVRSHTGERPYLRVKFQKGFVHQINSEDNHKRTHAGKKPYTCKTCRKKFTKKMGLANHMRIHTDERPFSCETCGQRFVSNASLGCHRRTHTGERPYSCETCGKTYKNYSNLEVHRRTHTGERPYSCETCGKTYKNSSNLEVHRRNHTGERPYPCTVCRKTFAVRAHLIRHTRIHTGEKLYPCDICGERFSYPYQAAAHRKTHEDGKL